MKDVHISPVLYKDLPCSMGDASHEEHVEDENGVDEDFDVCEVLREPDVVDVNLKSQNSKKCPIKALRKKLKAECD